MIYEYVWIVSIGETGQGGSVYGVFQKLEDAKTYVHREHPSFIFDTEQPTNYLMYHISTDWLKIEAHRVRYSSR